MTSSSSRILAGILAVVLLPLAAMAADSNAIASANSATNTAANAASAPEPGPAPSLKAINPDPLVQLLISKGILSANEANGLAGATTVELRDRLAILLKEKGILSGDDLKALSVTLPMTTASENGPTMATLTTQASAAPQTAPKPPEAPAVIPAVVPIRVLPVDPPKREGFIPDLKIGPVRVKPYGFFKSTVVYDSASPYGNDFPLPGFIGDINGPDSQSEFHIKARSLRLGTNFEWLDIVPNVTVTGKFEMDFEGNFSRVNNRNISTIRSSMPSIRLGYGRVDWNTSDKTNIFALLGQDWTPFGSTTLPNLLESTGLGIGFGTLYERAPQFRFGFNHKLGGGRNFSIGPEVAVVLPVFGNLPANLCSAPASNGATLVSCSATNPALSTVGLDNQLGYGERQGTDSARPEIEPRLVLQWQLDKAKGVAPAQIIFSGMQGERSAVVLASQVPLAFRAAFPTGARVSSSRYGYTAEIQLPTHFLTLVAKYYNGTGLRFFFAGQIFSEFNDTLGLTGVATAPSVDGASTVAFGLRAGVPVIANQLEPRAQGGFVNIGIPLSRLANAEPTGRNAGWTLYLHYGYDTVLARDIRRLGGGRQKGDLFSGQLQYKLNNFVTFAAEQSLYRTRAIPLTSTGNFPLFRGVPTSDYRDYRTEIGTIFTF
jgi:hypothetical protein